MFVIVTVERDPHFHRSNVCCQQCLLSTRGEGEGEGEGEHYLEYKIWLAFSFSSGTLTILSLGLHHKDTALSTTTDST